MPISNKTPEYIKIWHATFKISSTATVNFTKACILNESTQSIPSIQKKKHKLQVYVILD